MILSPYVVLGDGLGYFPKRSLILIFKAEMIKIPVLKIIIRLINH